MRGFPPKRIVVAVDLSTASRAALDAAKALGRRWGSTLELMHVRQPALAAVGVGRDAMPVLLPQDDAEFERCKEDWLRAAMTGFPAERVSVRMIQGSPVHELCERAAAGAADLLVMGTHGYAGLDRALRGSVAEAVIRAARMPVLTVQQSKVPLNAAQILAPWNDRPYATRALRYASALALSLGAELRVLHVVPSRLSVDESDPSLERKVERLLGPGSTPVWSLRVRVGDAREHIVREANSGRFGLVVVSAHRRPFSSDVVLGSTVERLLRHALVPVLAYPSGGPSLAH